MTIDASDYANMILVGIGATIVMDLWTVLLRHAFKLSSLSYCLVGRWLLHMPEGVFRHTSIATAQQKHSECVVGWIAHYAIGIAFSFMLVLLTSGAWLARPTLAPALLFGIATVTFPFFIMQPSFGLGLAASKTPNPAQARLKSLGTHTVFGFGLYASAVGLSHILRALS